ncbi:helix-hairpin-helix domain-containing protein [uncultured Phycicoccus sp.]|uniref:ComEA family DNA-binding protein n=1 Tax=uncultured Phycicoccus sp. TaxID=661422 RepID=UPI0026314B76|nr:helix-hairpin-helix domain-containing protein [uncultured Phycicoccus sp.]
MLSFVGFVYVAIRVQTKKFWIAATVGCVGSAAVWIIMALAGDLQESSQAAGTADGTSTTSDLGAGVAVAVWAGLLVYAVVLNRDYLRWRAGRSESNAWYNQPVGNAAGTNVAYVAPPSQAPDFLGIDQNDYFATPAQPKAQPPSAPKPPAPWRPATPVPPVAQAPTAGPAGPVDVNTATAATLASSLGIDPSLAARVVAIRDSRGGYATLDELVTTAGLQPHELLKFSGRVTLGQAERSTSPQTSTPPTPNKDRPGGRIIDI